MFIAVKVLTFYKLTCFLKVTEKTEREKYLFVLWDDIIAILFYLLYFRNSYWNTILLDLLTANNATCYFKELEWYNQHINNNAEYHIGG